MGSATVCLVEADPAIRDSLTTLLDLNGYEVRTFATGSAFLRSIGREDDILCVVCEAQLPDVSGLDVHEALQRYADTIPFALLISRRDDKIIDTARRRGITRYFLKPLVYRHLIEFVSGLAR